MCDEFIHPGLVETAAITRRSFGLIAIAAAGAASAGLPAADVTEKDITIMTSDGDADAVLFTPSTPGRFPAILMWPDIMGLRPAFREMGRRLASAGYVVLVPNPFYRSKKAPVLPGPIDFGNPAMRDLLTGYRKAMSDDGIDNDARSYLGFLDQQAKVNKERHAGVQGYCMGGALAFRTAAAVPARIGAIASFHGGNGLVTKSPDSPHLLIGKTNPHSLWVVLQAQNDDKQQPELKNELRTAFASAHRKATLDVYPANHGWCVPGSQVYDQAQAERAWTALLQLYRGALD